MGMRLTALVLMLCLAMSACSGDPEPVYADPTPPASGTPTSEPPTPSATVEPTPEVEKPPELPAAARRDDAVGAEAFMRHYWAMVNYAQSSLDTEQLSRLATQECVGCAGGKQFIDDVADSAGAIRGGQYTVVDVNDLVREPNANGQFTAVVILTSNAQRVTTPGDDPTTYPAGRSMQSMTVNWSRSNWRVDFLGPAS